MIKYVLFDLDGTLTDPALGITNGIMHMLEKKGLPVPPREELYYFIGPPLIPSFMSVFGMTKEEAEEGLLFYREYFSTVGLFENEPYEGIHEALRKIRARGLTVGLATSKPEEFAQRILERFGLIEYFDFVSGATMDEKRSKKSDVIRYALDRMGAKPEETVMVGDRLHDVEGAAVFGIPAVGVLWGYGSREELLDAGAVSVVATMDEMVAAVTEDRDTRMVADIAEAVTEASGKIAEVYRGEYKVLFKEDRSPVTSADLASERIILGKLGERYPECSVLSEERADEDNGDRLTNANGVFIVDPLDGTIEFVNRTGEFSVSVAYARDGKVVAGVIGVPEKDLLYYALEGRGAYKLTFDEYRKGFFFGCGERIHVSDRTEGLIVAVSRSFREEKTDRMTEMNKSRISEVLTVGSCYKGCLIAEGRADVHYRFGDRTKEWDSAGMQIIVKEAGGLFVSPSGEEIPANRADYVNHDGFVILNRKESALRVPE